MTEIVASSLVNIVKFKIDMASYRRTLKAIDNVKAKLKSLNSTINSNPALGGGPTPRGARQSINRVRDDARNFADAHVRQRRRIAAEVARAEEAAYREARAREVKRRKQAAANAAQASRQPTMGPSSELFYAAERRRKAALAAQRESTRRQGTTDLYSQRFDFAAGRSTRLSSSQVSQYRQQVQSLNAQFRAGTISGQQYREGIRQVGVTMRTANREALTMKERLRGMRSEILLFGLTAGAALKAITNVGSRFENTGIMMKTVFGEEAGGHMQFLSDQSERLGINLLDSVKAYSKIMFVGQELKMSTGEIQDMWLGMAETSKVFGQTQEEVVGSFRAIEQMLS